MQKMEVKRGAKCNFVSFFFEFTLQKYFRFGGERWPFFCMRSETVYYAPLKGISASRWTNQKLPSQYGSIATRWSRKKNVLISCFSWNMCISSMSSVYIQNRMAMNASIIVFVATSLHTPKLIQMSKVHCPQYAFRQQEKLLHRTSSTFTDLSIRQRPFNPRSWNENIFSGQLGDGLLITLK